MRWGDVLFIDGAIWSIGMVHAYLSPFQTHEYLIKIYFHILLELNLICINFLKNISLTSVVSIFLKYL